MRFKLVCLFLSLFALPSVSLTWDMSKWMPDTRTHSMVKRQCAMCIAGDFLDKKDLMVDVSIGQMIVWNDEWDLTDCWTGDVVIKECASACVSIYTKSKTREGWFWTSVLMDCSEALIWSSPDLSLKPTTMVLLDGVYVASRKGHDIKYIFSTNNNNSTLDIREHIFSFMVPGIRQKRTTFGTKVLLASIAVIMIFVVLALLKIVYKEERSRKNKDDREPVVSYCRDIKEHIARMERGQIKHGKEFNKNVENVQDNFTDKDDAHMTDNECNMNITDNQQPK